MTADHIDRAAEVILNNGARSIRDGSAWTSPQDDDQIMEDCRDIAQALVDAGRLATPEHDAAVRADERAKVLAGFKWEPDDCSVEFRTHGQNCQCFGPRTGPRVGRWVGPWEPTPDD